MDVHHFSRRSFEIQAVQITVDNIVDVARWCNGQIGRIQPAEEFINPNLKPGAVYIAVTVAKFKRPQIIRAYVEDWVTAVKPGTVDEAFKVFNGMAFAQTFAPVKSKDERRADVWVLVNNAMAKQDAATYHGDSRGMDLVCDEIVDKILALF